MNTRKKGMFEMDDGRNLIVTFALVCSLFFLWAVCNGMIDVMDKHFQEELHLSLSQSAWVQFAHYLGYFLMAMPAGWLATKLEASGQQQASWRVDPKRAGGSGCGGDIGTHALMQLRFVTGLDVTAVSAQLETFVEGRQLDDHCTIYCKLSNGGRAMVRASQICTGYKNDLGIVIAGTKGSLRWRAEEPESITVCLPNQPDRTYWRGAVTPGDGWLPKDMPADLMAEPTIPSGHPEAFHDAFARLHRCFEVDIRKWKAGGKFIGDGSKYANIEDGWMGIAFIETCVKSNAKHGAWTNLPKKI